MTSENRTDPTDERGTKLGAKREDVWRKAGLADEDRELDAGETIRPETLDPNTISVALSGETDRVSFELAVLLGSLPRVPVDEGTGEPPGADLLVRDTLGRGGMGVVERARQRSLMRDVALKRVRPEVDEERTRHSLLQEALVTGRLEHPNIIPVYGVGTDQDGRPFLIMKRIEGVAWRELIKDPEHERWSRVETDRIEFHVRVLIQVCNALEFAHTRGIVHRDMKPDNVMIGDFGEVYVLDWGVARPPGLIEDERIAGTPAYMAPEMVLYEAVTPQTDVYLIAAALHEVLTGKPPHPGRTFYEAMASILDPEPFFYAPEVPTELAEIANRALNREPEDRHASAAELRRDLEGFLEHRASIELTDVALKKLETFQEALKKDGHAPQARGAFTESRFGFREALRIWPENARAREGLDRCLEEMIRVEIEGGHIEAAAELFAEMSSAPATVEERLALLEEQARQARQRRREADRRARANDPRLSAAARGRIMLAISVLMTIVVCGGGLWFQLTGTELSPEHHLYSGIGFATLVSLLISLQLRGLKQRLGRRILMAMGIYFWSYLPMRAAAWSFGMSTRQEWLFEDVVTSLFLITLGLLFDRRLIRTSSLLILHGLIAFFLPQWFYGATGLLLTGTALWIGWITVVGARRRARAEQTRSSLLPHEERQAKD